MNENVILWVWLKLAVRDKNLEAYKLYKHFGSIEKIYKASREEIAMLDFVNADSKEGICEKNTAAAREIVRECEQNKVTIIPADDPRYPKQLLEIKNFPCVLFVYGEYEEALSRPMITIIGARECTSYGTRCAEKLSEILCYAGFTVVTGVADGIDTAVITGAMNCNGSIIAVLPKGMASMQLGKSFKFKNMRNHGAFISEYLPSSHSHKFVYQERNRILSGLCVGTVVIQAKKSSGSLMTANYAIEQNRDVFALPGNIDMSASEGVNALIKEGAIPIASLTTVVDYYKPVFGDQINDNIPEHMLIFSKVEDADSEESKYELKRIAVKHLDEYELMVFNILQSGATDVDTIIEKTNLPPSYVMPAITGLEAEGLIESHLGNQYKIKI